MRWPLWVVYHAVEFPEPVQFGQHEAGQLIGAGGAQGAHPGEFIAAARDGG